ncbi:hypothetical protein [Helicobacter sp. MIT 99-5507]|uniref:hypothetical protein n=1 Tax=Helicobacter sp. MIT 99-5507 TaxID=152489 RepID=UPI000E1EE43C|nr:hypothetical protein [Helicobacter sp. MIT 99-5507]RDU57894.1 hypothetical protein CQA42_03050 [Helicobacter sp. MIT 99-5507]
MEALALSHAIGFHYAIGISLLIIIIANLIILFINDFYKVHKYMWYLTPVLFGILAVTLISGFSIFAMMKFHINFMILLMIFINIAIIALEIKRIKKLRIVRKKPSLIKNYIKQSRILYTIYLFATLIFFLG